ncbi:hypothetical protein Tco_1080928 [Tanacetum coccineum]|uniref:DUF4283 domain-containing protein n=1 Tax=Tanacetum coccineum TaxID=301880 RepID=A0ABQ5HW52_9ASTR
MLSLIARRAFMREARARFEKLDLYSYEAFQTFRNAEAINVDQKKNDDYNGNNALGTVNIFITLIRYYSPFWSVTFNIFMVQANTFNPIPSIEELADDVGHTSISSTVDPNSSAFYAKLFIDESSRKSVNFRILITSAGNGTNVAIPLESIRAISERFVNTTYGFFLRKRVTYLLVANYVRNTWGKYGVVKSMFNSSTELFFFQFSSMGDLDSLLANEDVVNVPVWVKLYGVPVTAFSEDCLSAIATAEETSSSSEVVHVFSPVVADANHILHVSSSEVVIIHGTLL